MPSTYQRLRVDRLLERTWVNSNDQAPANALAELQGNSQKCACSARHQSLLWQLQRSLDSWREMFTYRPIASTVRTSIAPNAAPTTRPSAVKSSV